MGSIKQTSGPADAILRKLIQSSRKQGKVGWFDTAKYEDGTPVAYVAAIQEHGSPAQGIPPRPFLRTTIAARQAAWRDLTHSGAQRILDGKASVADVLNIVGLRAAGDIAKTIRAINQPALKASTVLSRLRGKANGGVKNGAISITAAKPLVDTGTLLNTLSHTVEDK